MEGARRSQSQNRLREFVERARESTPLSVAVVDAAEEHVLRGAFDAAELGLAEPILVGDRKQIARVCEACGCPGDRFPVVEARNPSRRPQSAESISWSRARQLP